MEVTRQLLYRFARWEYLGLTLLVLASLAMHFSIIGAPPEPMFDEQHYVPDAQAIVAGHGELRQEHPPLGQAMIASGIILFGDNAVGWRFFPVVFGGFGIVFFYLLCRRLGMGQWAALPATFLFTFEVLTFIQASIAMLDVFSVTFMLAAFWLYLRGNYTLSGAAICLSTLAKLTGALALLAIVAHWIMAKRDRPIRFSFAMILPPLLFFALLPVLDYALTGQITNPLSRSIGMLTASSGVTFSDTVHFSASRPWEWLRATEMIPYWWEPPYIATISYTVSALIIPTMAYMGYLAKKGNAVGLFAVAWFACTYLIWIPLSIITDRMSFVYYFYPTIGAVCLGLGWALSRLIDSGEIRGSRRFRLVAIGALCYLALHLAIFVILTPVFSVPVAPDQLLPKP